MILFYFTVACIIIFFLMMLVTLANSLLTTYQQRKISKDVIKLIEYEKQKGQLDPEFISRLESLQQSMLDLCHDMSEVKETIMTELLEEKRCKFTAKSFSVEESDDSFDAEDPFASLNYDNEFDDDEEDYFGSSSLADVISLDEARKSKSSLEEDTFSVDSLDDDIRIEESETPIVHLDSYDSVDELEEFPDSKEDSLEDDLEKYDIKLDEEEDSPKSVKSEDDIVKDLLHSLENLPFVSVIREDEEEKDDSNEGKPDNLTH